MKNLKILHPQEPLKSTMELSKSTHFFLLLFVIFCSRLYFCSCTDIITSTQFISDPESIFSNDKHFKLGFFTPPNSTNRYLAILYNISTTTPVWVANRDKPLNDSSGIVTISEDGNLLILNGQKGVIWSSNISNLVTNSTAKLLDSGNLVLLDNTNGRTIWESFNDPSDSFLPTMRVGARGNRERKNLLTSWKSNLDPGTGIFSAGLDPQNIAEIFVWNGSRPYWRSGPWTGRIFIGIPKMDSVYVNGFSLVSNDEGDYFSFTHSNGSSNTYFVLNYDGNLMQRYWVSEKRKWDVSWSAVKSECDMYGKCGVFGSCDKRNSPICGCLDGFEPKDKEEWENGIWRGGCVRRENLRCERNGTLSGEEGKEDGFLRLRTMKVPDFAVWSNAPEGDCGSKCLENCSCLATAFYTGIGCMHWYASLIDIQKFEGGGVDLYIRVAHSELGKKKHKKVIIAITATIGSITIAICAFIFWKWMARRKERRQKGALLFKRGESGPGYSNKSLDVACMNQAKFEELPLYNLEELKIATENFHIDNKLGEGGFGPVYKGKMPDGLEIAVKRLSTSSGQGLEEFMNEVVVISKLQHRNLVRLLGCCIEGDEKMLIYEYMPNGSLDTLLFGAREQESLDWSQRINIIQGIGRGLLYLHRDSRLKIIHRDMKASNILLDEELNPKISDFGMARIFGGNQDQANTRRVVGTYGYMAPEYAMQGRFSEKSDVFSFGVLLLEIVSGRRNTSFYEDEHFASLLGFAWELWNEDNFVELIDPRISDPRLQTEIFRYIQVGLLCVQEFASDRPIVSTVLSMLSCEIADLPIPKQPAFTERHNSSHTQSTQSHERYSMNNLTVTIVQGR